MKDNFVKKYKEAKTKLNESFGLLITAFPFLPASLVSMVGALSLEGLPLSARICAFIFSIFFLSVWIGALIVFFKKRTKLNRIIKSLKPIYDKKIHEYEIIKKELYNCVLANKVFIKNNKQIVFIIDKDYFAYSRPDPGTIRIAKICPEENLIEEIDNEFVVELFKETCDKELDKLDKADKDKNFSEFIDEICLTLKSSLENTIEQKLIKNSASKKTYF